MVAAVHPGESIAGQRITYSFGRVDTRRRGTRYSVSFKLNGHAVVVQRWDRASGTWVPPIPNPDRFDELYAKSASGSTDEHHETGRVHAGSHREFTGYLDGDAVMTVRVPRASVAHPAH